MALLPPRRLAPAKESIMTPPGPGDLTRLVSCGVPGHAPYPDTDGECAACVGVAEAAEAALEFRRLAAIAGARREHRYYSLDDLLRSLARDIKCGDVGSIVVALAALADRECEERRPTAGWLELRAACADWLIAFDEREAAEHAAAAEEDCT